MHTLSLGGGGGGGEKFSLDSCLLYPSRFSLVAAGVSLLCVRNTPCVSSCVFSCLPLQERSGTLVNLALGEQEGTLLSSRTFDGVVVSIAPPCFFSFSYAVLSARLLGAWFSFVLMDTCGLPVGMSLALEVGETESLRGQPYRTCTVPACLHANSARSSSRAKKSCRAPYGRH